MTQMGVLRLYFYFMIAEKLVELRTSKGWNQEELAKRTGISRVMISRYENGTIPYKTNLRKLLKAFNLPLDYFHKLSIDKSQPNRHSDDSTLNQVIEDLLKFPKKEQQHVIALIESLKKNTSQQIKEKKLKHSVHS